MVIHDMDMDVTKIDPRESVYQNFGGMIGPFKFEIDEVLVHSCWRPNFTIAEKYASDGGRIFLAGDSGKSYTQPIRFCRHEFQSLQPTVRLPMAATVSTSVSRKRWI
jgi:hypothetical protein